MPESIIQLRKKLEISPKEFNGRKLLCIPSLYDRGDYKYQNIFAISVASTPAPIDYRPNLPPVYNQLQRGACVAEGWAGTLKASENIAQGDYPSDGFSIAFLYSECKKNDGIPNQEGTTPKIAAQILQKIGVCPESFMPYSTLTNLPIPKVPLIPDSAVKAAEKYKIKSYAQICSMADKDRSGLINVMRQALKTGPFVLALLVCENFTPDNNNRLPLPEGNVRGGHLVGIVGDLPSLECFILRNSWGDKWGEKGYSLLPYKWVTSKYDTGWYVFEAWTAVSLFVPKQANKIEITPGSEYMTVDGQNIYLDQPAIIDPKTNRTVLPVRSVASNMGYLTQVSGNKIVLTKPNA